MKLYIIGNGFDIAHGMPTRYSDYKRFLDTNYPEVSTKYTSSLYIEAGSKAESDLWSDVEQNLRISIERCKRDFLATKTSGSLHSKLREIYLNPQIDDELSFLHKFTGAPFCKWLQSISLPRKSERKFIIDEHANYVTFNYTQTLEVTYGIDAQKILHIHGSLEQPETIQFGNPDNDPEGVDEKLKEKVYDKTNQNGVNQIKMYASYAYKSISKSKATLKNFLRKVGCVDEVVIIGHSLLSLDEGYYRDVLVPYYGELKWTIYVYTFKGKVIEKEEIEAFIKKYKLKNISIVHYENHTLSRG